MSRSKHSRRATTRRPKAPANNPVRVVTNSPAPRSQERSGRRDPRQWALDNRTRLMVASLNAGLAMDGEILSVPHDGWRTALALGALGAAAAGAHGWTPSFEVKWLKFRHAQPALTDRIIALSAPVTGSGLLAAMAATGGPHWGADPLWGLSALWSIGYGTYWWRRMGRTPTVAAGPALTAQMLDWETYAAVADGPYPHAELLQPLDTGNGWTAQILVPRRKRFQMYLEETASALDIDDLTLIALEVLGPRKGRITVMKTNPLKEGTRFGDSHVLDPDTGLAPIGVYYDGETASYRFFLPGSGAVHSFVTGTSGSGKSRLLDALLGIERRSPLVCSIVIDPQNGLSLPDWPDGVACFAPGCDFGIVVLRALKAIMEERSARYNRMKWVDDQGRTRTGRAFFVPGDPDPLISATLDEAHKLLKHPLYGEEAAQIIGDLVKEARKVGIKFRLANQSPNASELGGETLIRDILQGGNNAVLRSGSAATGKRAAGSALDGVDPGAIPKEFADGTSTAGMGYLAGPDSRAAMWRAPLVEDPYGLAHQGFTTGIEQATIDKLPIVRHILAEHALMLQLREEGIEYSYDPARFAEGRVNTTKRATAPVTPTTAWPTGAATDTATVPAAQAPEPPAVMAVPAVPDGTIEKIAAHLHKIARPCAPAAIAKALELTGPQVRKALQRAKDDPDSAVTSISHGVWVHRDHAADYRSDAA